MDHEHIITAFKAVVSKSQYASNYSVFAPIIEIDQELHLLFEVRSLDLQHQPGEVCFPGGKIEENETPIQSAIRETMEELNISEEHIEVIGELRPFTTLFNVVIYPFCGFIKNIDIKDIKYSRDEVDSIFTVPLKDLVNQNPKVHHLGIKLNADSNFPYELIQNGKDYDWMTSNYPIYFYQYNAHVIWGLTARIVKSVVDIIKI